MVGNIIRYVRQCKGYTQEELGKILSLADTTISSYERGNSQPDFDTVIKILNICEFDLKMIDKRNGKFVDMQNVFRKI